MNIWVYVLISSALLRDIFVIFWNSFVFGMFLNIHFKSYNFKKINLYLWVLVYKLLLLYDIVNGLILWVVCLFFLFEKWRGLIACCLIYFFWLILVQSFNSFLFIVAVNDICSWIKKAFSNIKSLIWNLDKVFAVIIHKGLVIGENACLNFFIKSSIVLV